MTAALKMTKTPFNVLVATIAAHIGNRAYFDVTARINSIDPPAAIATAFIV